MLRDDKGYLDDHLEAPRQFRPGRCGRSRSRRCHRHDPEPAGSCRSARRRAAFDPDRPPGRGGYPLPALPAVFDTYQHKVRVSVVARGLDRPWSLLILPDGDMLVSMRYSNQIRAIRKGVLDPDAARPACRRCGACSTSCCIRSSPRTSGSTSAIQGGHREPDADGARARPLRRRRRSRDVQDLYVSDPSLAGRVAHGVRAGRHDLHDRQRRRRTQPNGGPDPRKLDTVYGKVIRLRDDGTVPPDNPFVGQAGRAAGDLLAAAIAITSASRRIR